MPEPSPLVDPLNAELILLPFLGMMLLTLVVWAYMYTLRLGYIAAHRIPSQELTTPDKAARLIPDEVSYPAHNLRNLLELPVLFYALCLYLYLTAAVDQVLLVSAWTFLLLRTVHSAIHCTVNNVKWRFLAYFASGLVLWFMLVRSVLDFAGG